MLLTVLLHMGCQAVKCLSCRLSLMTVWCNLSSFYAYLNWLSTTLWQFAAVVCSSCSIWGLGIFSLTRTSNSEFGLPIGLLNLLAGAFMTTLRSLLKLFLFNNLENVLYAKQGYNLTIIVVLNYISNTLQRAMELASVKGASIGSQLSPSMSMVLLYTGLVFRMPWLCAMVGLLSVLQLSVPVGLLFL